MNITAYDKYQEEEVEFDFPDDEIYLDGRTSGSTGIWGKLPIRFKKGEPKRWSDLTNIKLKQ